MPGSKANQRTPANGRSADKPRWGPALLCQMLILMLILQGFRCHHIIPGPVCLPNHRQVSHRSVHSRGHLQSGTIIMKKILLGVLLAGTAMSAQAADLGPRPYTKAPPMAPVYDWTGLYFGVNAGLGVGRNQTVHNFGPGAISTHL